MRVEEIMTTKVFTVKENDLIDRVFFLINYEKIRHLPVVEKGKVIGIISDRDLYKSLGPKSNSNVIDGLAKTSELQVVETRVRNIMRRGVITTTPDALLSVVAGIMAEHKIGALPVIDSNNKLVGIVSATDILRVFSKLEHIRENCKKSITEEASHS
ncbi:MAG: CBS domain-containing protein [Methylococcales bacterium]|nr:CBS domain-containing protein [Methylococcales bacterium]